MGAGAIQRKIIDRGVSSMSSVIDFLEKIGSDAQWRTASPDDMELALAETEVEAPLRDAILTKDASKIEALLRQVPLFSVMIPDAPPDEEEEEEGDEDGDSEKPHQKAACNSLFSSLLPQA